MHIHDTDIPHQPRAVVPAGYTLAKLNVSGDGSQMPAAYNMHLLSVNMANAKKKNSTLALASQKLCAQTLKNMEGTGKLR